MDPISRELIVLGEHQLCFHEVPSLAILGEDGWFVSDPVMNAPLVAEELQRAGTGAVAYAGHVLARLQVGIAHRRQG